MSQYLLTKHSLWTYQSTQAHLQDQSIWPHTRAHRTYGRGKCSHWPLYSKMQPKSLELELKVKSNTAFRFESTVHNTEISTSSIESVKFAYYYGFHLYRIYSNVAKQRFLASDHEFRITKLSQHCWLLKHSFITKGYEGLFTNQGHFRVMGDWSVSCCCALVCTHPLWDRYWQRRKQKSGNTLVNTSM